MSYKFETQYDSPNFTSGNAGRQMIIIHWWDAPENNPSYEGTISTLCNPNRGASAHFVATGTGRRVACLVNLEDTAWHAGTSNPATNPNPISIGIECDPRCRDEDYDVVAELIANIRSAYGDLPLRGHREFVATQCPGNWDLARLDKLARTKDGSVDWGVVTDIKPVIVIPVPEPTPVEPEVPVVVEPETPVEVKPEPTPETPHEDVPVEPVPVDNTPRTFAEFLKECLTIILAQKDEILALIKAILDKLKK